MRKRIIKLSSTRVGITLNPTVLAYLGTDSKETINYTLDMTLKDNSIILKDPIKEEKKEKE